MEVHYRPAGPVTHDFLADKAFFRGIQGPVGSGKSSACCMAIMKAATEINPCRDGVRRSRWAVIRNTYPELKTTTIKTWQQWFPEKHFGNFLWTPPFTHAVKFGDVELEVLFLAMDQEEDVGKVLSLDLTGAWINEAREIPKSVLDAITMRLGRYPQRADAGNFDYGMIADTNAPAEDHWWAIMSGQAPVPEHYTDAEAISMGKPDDWNFYHQPEGMTPQFDKAGRVTGWLDNPKAENLENLPQDYYRKLLAGKRQMWGLVYVGNRIGSAQGGRAVYPEFRTELHVIDDMDPDPRLPIIIGIDFGLTPAAIFAQRHTNRGFHVFDEIVPRDMTVKGLAEAIRGRIVHWTNKLQLEGDTDMSRTFNDYEAWGDPAGDARSPHDEQKRTTFQLLDAYGVHARPAPSNDPVLRVEAVSSLLTEIIDGNPAIVISSRVRTLIRGFEDGYSYRKKRGQTEQRFEDKPEKNQYSHPHDALQYLVLGSGVGRELKRRRAQAQVGNTRGQWNPYDHATALTQRASRLRAR